MCAVSAITDYYRDKWPVFELSHYQGPAPTKPIMILDSSVKITKEQWAEYQELKSRMEQYDIQTNQPDCVKPEVAEWEAVVQSAVQQQEGQ